MPVATLLSTPERAPRTAATSACGAEIEVRIAHREADSADVAPFHLVCADGAALPAFATGAHLEPQLPNGLTRRVGLAARRATGRDEARLHRQCFGATVGVASHDADFELLIGSGRRLHALRLARPRRAAGAGPLACDHMPRPARARRCQEKASSSRCGVCWPGEPFSARR